MADLYITPSGDLAVSPTGDIAVTQTPWRDDIQQVYIRLMTDQGDFLPYPSLGANLSSLFGEPQSPDTGERGIDLIHSAMKREGRFISNMLTVKAIPTGPQTIRFDVTITSGSKEKITLSVEQDLGV